MVNSRAKGMYVKLAEHIPTGTANTVTLTLSPLVDFDTQYTKIIVEIQLSFTATCILQCEIQGSTTSCNIKGFFDDGATLVPIALGSQTENQLASALLITGATGITGNFTIQKENDAGTKRFIGQSHFMRGGGGGGTYEQYAQRYGSAAQTTLNSIVIQTSTSTWIAGGYIRVYGLRQ